MKTLSWEEFVAGPVWDRPFAATVGVFDGIHRGHLALIDRIRSEPGHGSAVFTFRDNPKRLLRPSAFHGDLFTLQQKLDALASRGVEVCVLIDFSGDFSKLAGRIFLSFLAEIASVRLLVLGSDFRCGYRLDTGVAEIESYCSPRGIRTEVFEPILWAGHPVSSSRIRKAVVEGRLEEAAEMLGRPFELDLRSADCSQPGCVRLELDGLQVLPPPGRYEAIVVGAAGQRPGFARCEGSRWFLDGAEGDRPEALRLISLVSRV